MYTLTEDVLAPGVLPAIGSQHQMGPQLYTRQTHDRSAQSATMMNIIMAMQKTATKTAPPRCFGMLVSSAGGRGVRISTLVLGETTH